MFMSTGLLLVVTGIFLSYIGMNPVIDLLISLVIIIMAILFLFFVVVSPE